MQIALTFRNTLSNVKRRVLHIRGLAMCYITRRPGANAIRGAMGAVNMFLRCRYNISGCYFGCTNGVTKNVPHLASRLRYISHLGQIPRIATRIYLFISTIDVGGSCWLRRSVSAATARANGRKALPTGLLA